MGVSLRVGAHSREVGTPDFLNAFFTTISYHLEPDGWGSRFPVLMGPLYEGKLACAQAKAVTNELRTARKELKRYPPHDVVWDADDLSRRPPWGDDISPDIKNLSDYFATSEGEDLFEVMFAMLSKLDKKKSGSLVIE